VTHRFGRDASHWMSDARAELLSFRAPGCGWGYRRGGEACVEPTALAALALRATSGDDATRSEASQIGSEASECVARAQRPDGSLGVSPTRATPGWMTPYALLLWDAFGACPDRAARATAWLLKQSGATLARSDDPRGVAGHDTTIVGWPWVSDTHSWVEPTALAVMALGKVGQGSHPRVQEGLRLICDRSVAGGGWNYGNKAVFGTALRAQPAPTGIALLALASAGNEPRGPMIRHAVDFLRATLPGTRASASLSWGLLGLKAWGEVPEESDRWLAEARAAVAGRADAGPKLACLLLAAGKGSLDLFRFRCDASQGATA
jgi:hypothetical protein